MTDVRDNDLYPMLQERAGHSEPDPTRASRDERDLIFDIFHLMVLLILAHAPRRHRAFSSMSEKVECKPRRYGDGY
ncbi:hypothetical protein [Bradyrhizobium sp. USDA 336]|uniref:hypothetical protein n=1 Tax=Bradyrhizobium sp. USDA 336 TaxID=3156311 RepID=UPI0038511617